MRSCLFPKNITLVCFHKKWPAQLASEGLWKKRDWSLLPPALKCKVGSSGQGQYWDCLDDIPARWKLMGLAADIVFGLKSAWVGIRADRSGQHCCCELWGNLSSYQDGAKLLPWRSWEGKWNCRNRKCSSFHIQQDSPPFHIAPLCFFASLRWLLKCSFLDVI